MLSSMRVSRRDALRTTGLAAGLAVMPGMAERAPARRPRPWWELGMADPVLDQVLLFYLGATWQGQADVGEVLDTANRVDPKDEWSWPREWTRTADRLRHAGAEIARQNHRRSAGETLMRASTYYRAALHRFPQPADPRAKRLARRAAGAFARAVELLELPAERVRIPYERTTLPGYLFRAPRRRAPLLIVHEGRDAWAEDCLYLAEGATRRGYHCLVFDGPGQGTALRLQGLPFRPDWERVVTPVVDFAVGRPEVDRKRIALMGISMGGALAPRAAAFERRLKILVANPGVLNWAELIDGQMRQFLGAEVYGLLESDPRAFDARVADRMRRDAFLRWGVRDLVWKHGARSPSQALLAMKAYDNRDSVARITARTLVMDGTGDPWAQGRRLFAAVRAPKDYMLFTAEDTGLLHVQNGALGVGSQRLFDWLDDEL